MQTTMQKHLAAIQAGEVTKTNVIGIRKALNHVDRMSRGRPGNCSSATPAETDAVMSAIWETQPRVTGDLHESGLEVLRSPRYRKRLASVQPVIDALESFHLVDYDEVAGGYYVPVYEARSPGGSFTFRNVPWQSGGDGPEVLNGWGARL